MNQLKISLIAVAAGLAFTGAAQADPLTKPEYKAGKENIERDYKAAKKACDAQAGNAKSICVEQAKGDEKVSAADLDYRLEPTAKSHFKARVARADSAYEVADQRCKDKAGNDKDVCVKEAKAAKVHAVADAETQMKAWKANTAANEAVADANTKASDTVADANAKANNTVAGAKRDAASDKRDADYAVAKEKCEAQAGPAKDRCISNAKSLYGQH